MIHQQANRGKARNSSGCKPDWDRLVDDHLDFAYRVAGRFLTSPVDIQDAIQAAFIKAWKSFQQFDPNRSLFSTWFFTILKNTCIDARRRLAHAPLKAPLDAARFLAGHPDEAPDEHLARQELYTAILFLADRLPEKQKDCFLLRDVQGFSLKETAALTGQSEGSVKTSVYLARKKIRQWIEKEKYL